MPSIEPCPLPAQALLARYADAGAYADCYTTNVGRPVSHAEYVEAFYTGRLFKVERLLLSLFLSRPSTDLQVKQLATGESDDFAAWRVEGRAADQLLMRDVGGRTRSWLMVSPVSQAPMRTQLYFGSAVVPAVNRSTGKPRMGLLFKALLGFHKLYSRALLGSARARLERGGMSAKGAMFVIKAEVGDASAERLAFNGQKTMYGGKHIAKGDTVFVFASENEGGPGLVARGTVVSAAAVAKKPGVERQTPRVSIVVQHIALAKRRLGRSELKPFSSWNDGRAQTELNFKLYRQATDKIVAVSDKTAAFLDRFF